MSSKLQLDVRTGECLLSEGLVWYIAAVVCSLAAYRGYRSLARAINSHI